MSKSPQQNTHLQGDPAAPNVRDPRQKGDELDRHPEPAPKNAAAKEGHPEQPADN